MSALVVPNPRPQSTYYSHAPYMTNFGKPPGLMGRPTREALGSGGVPAATADFIIGTKIDV